MPILSRTRPSLSNALLSSALLALAWLSPLAARAQEFALVVSPPRIEDRVKPGTTYRNVIEINNTSAKSGHFMVSTADWKFDAQNSPVFTQALTKNSCRPWVGIETKDITVKGNGKRRYRFEVAVPADAPRGECTFGLMIEGDPQVARGNVPLPISGRIGIIVYLAIGDAAPKLEVLETRTDTVQGRKIPVLRIRNNGDLHGRLDGYLAAVDAKGKRIVLVPENSPILVGATRDIPLFPQSEGATAAPPEIVYPVRIKGRLDAERQRLDIEATLTQ